MPRKSPKPFPWLRARGRARPPRRGLLLAFDFDGVLCDSARECFRSAVAGYRESAGDAPGFDAPSFERAFLRRRWAGRHAWHFAPLLDTLLEDPVAPDFAARFAAHCERWRPRAAAFEAAFFAARHEAMTSHPDAWLRQNPPFDGALRLFRRLHADSSAAVVSAKNEHAIKRWLGSFGIEVPDDLLYGHEKTSLIGKAGALRALVKRRGPAGLLDDNLDNLREAAAEGFPVWLACWGYLAPGDRAAARVNGIGSLTLSEVA